MSTGIKVSVSDPYSLNPDPANNLNPDQDPVPDPGPSYFLPLFEIFFKLLISYKYRYRIIFSHQKKSIEKQNVVKSHKNKIIL